MHDEHSRAGSPHMTRLGPAIAEALLAGPWEYGAMLERARGVLVRAPRKLPELVRDVRSAYPEPPLDAARELAAFVDAVLVVGPRERPRVVRRTPYHADMVRREWPVAPLATPQDVAALLGVDAGTLDWLADVRSLERRVCDDRLRHYRWTFTPRDAGRPPRPIAAPKQRLKTAQRLVLREILDQIPAHDASHGFVRRRSALTNAGAHVGRRVVLHFDLEDFFANVSAGRVYGIFRTAGYPEAVAHVLTGLVTTVIPLHAWDALPRPTELRAITAHHRLGRRLAQPHLPQGAPSSTTPPRMARTPQTAPASPTSADTFTAASRGWPRSTPPAARGCASSSTQSSGASEREPLGPSTRPNVRRTPASGGTTYVRRRRRAAAVRTRLAPAAWGASTRGATTAAPCTTQEPGTPFPLDAAVPREAPNRTAQAGAAR